MIVDHATVHRWAVHDAPLLLERFNARRRARAIDGDGDKVEF
jgi:transposase-like protein